MLLLILTALLVASQDTKSTFLISGTVVEPGTDQAIPGAVVKLTGAGDEFPLFTETDSAGAFRFDIETAGPFQVSVQKNGYGRAGPIFDPELPAAPRGIVDSSHRQRVLKLFLAQPGKISGVVIDAETKKPVANLIAVANQAEWRSGHREAFLSSIAQTEPDGSFSIGAAPGEYLVSLAVLQPREGRLRTQFTDDDLKAVDLGYAQTYWPGGGSADTGSPVTLYSGGSVTVGQLLVRKSPHYRIHASLSGCAPGAMIQLNLETRRDSLSNGERLGTIPCGKEALIAGIEPGTYWIEAFTAGPDPTRREMASIAFTIGNRNIDLAIPLQPGVDIDGRVVSAEGAAKPPVIDLRLAPASGIDYAPEKPRPTASDGTFRLSNVEIREQRLVIDPPAPFYVKEVLYNGARLAGTTFAVDAFAGTQTLTVVIDDKAASVSGRVERDGDADQPADAVICRWPVGASPYSAVKRAPVDDNGKFQFSGLAPGDYRLFAILRSTRKKLEEPGVLDRLLRAADTISLTPGGFQNVTLKPAGPR